MSASRSRSPSSSLSPPPPVILPPVSQPTSPHPAKAPPRKKAKKEEVDPAALPIRSQSSLRIGAHVSAAGGVDQACVNAASIGATALALFVKSQRKWTSAPLEQISVDLFKTACQKFAYDAKTDMLPHGSYLVNLANPDPAKREKSYECFLDDLQRCEALGMGLYNFHPGSSMKEDRATAIGYVAESINRAHRATSSIIIVLENMAGQGDVLGSRFEDLRDIIALVEDKDRVGVCIDTCHLFAASPSNDIRTPSALHSTLSSFFSLVSPKYLKAMHINDSKFDLGSKKDRHENLGLGFIGLEGFWNLLHWPGLEGDASEGGEWEGWKGVIWVLETPSSENPTIWKREIELLHQLEALQDPSQIPALQQAWKSECQSLHAAVKKKPAKGKKATKGDDDAEVEEEDTKPIVTNPKRSRSRKVDVKKESDPSGSEDEVIRPPTKRSRIQEGRGG